MGFVRGGAGSDRTDTKTPQEVFIMDMRKSLLFFVMSILCQDKHRTIVNDGDSRTCLFCGVEVPEGFGQTIALE
jgi:hypothetical protein